MKFVRSPWFLYSVAALLAASGMLIASEREWLFGLAGVTFFWAVIETLTVVFGSGGHHTEARFDTRNDD